MANSYKDSSVALYLMFALSAALFLSIAAELPVYADCAQILRPGWPGGAEVYVDLSSITDQTERTQFESAIAKWNEENRDNGTGIHFTIGQPPSGLSNPYTLTIQNGTPSVAGRAAETSYTNHSGNALQSATITINTSLQIPGPNGTTTPFYDPNLPASYATIFYCMS